MPLRAGLLPFEPVPLARRSDLGVGTRAPLRECGALGQATGMPAVQTRVRRLRPNLLTAAAAGVSRRLGPLLRRRRRSSFRWPVDLTYPLDRPSGVSGWFAISPVRRSLAAPVQGAPVLLRPGELPLGVTEILPQEPSSRQAKREENFKETLCAVKALHRVEKRPDNSRLRSHFRSPSGPCGGWSRTAGRRGVAPYHRTSLAA